MMNAKYWLVATAISSTVAGYAADNYGTTQPLPLQVSERQHAFFVDGTWGTYRNNEIDFSGSQSTRSGGAIVDYVFTDVPGKLSINLTTPTTCSSSHAHKVYFYVYEDSSDNTSSTGTQIGSYQAGTTISQDFVLQKTTRRVRFYFKKEGTGTLNLGTCKYSYKVNFDLAKSIHATDKEVSFQGLLGNVKDTIAVNYSYPQGDLVVENGSNADFKLRKLTEGSEAGKEGTILVEVSYEPQAAQAGTADIIIRDNGYTDNFETIKISAEATTLFVPNAPTTLSTEKATFTTAHINWNAATRATSYKVNLYDKNQSLIHSFTTQETSAQLQNLGRGEHFYVGIVTIADNAMESAESELFLVETLNDFGQQLANNSFEAWEEITGFGMEPLSWNSFATVTGNSFLVSQAKAVQIQKSEEVREGAKGSYSAEVFSRNAFGSFWANGNLTTGRINAGSITATDVTNNYNFSDLSSVDHYQVINEIPDSATLWIKYTPNDASLMNTGANVSFVVHGDDGVVANRVKEPATTDNPLRYAVAETAITTTNEWVRISVPFKRLHEPAADTKKYILVSITTNGTPGLSTGGGKDVILVDDIVFVYPNNVTVEDPTALTFDEEDEISVPFTLEGSFEPSNANFVNQVTLQLSDENGSFENARTISEPLTTYSSGVITGKIPSNIPASSDYRVRAVTTYGNKASEANPTALTIHGTSEPTSIEVVEQLNLTLYPNPAREQIAIKGASDAAYRIYNLAGRVLKAGNGDLTTGIFVGDLAQGAYFIEVQCNNQVARLKFIKE